MDSNARTFRGCRPGLVAVSALFNGVNSAYDPRGGMKPSAFRSVLSLTRTDLCQHAPLLSLTRTDLCQHTLPTRFLPRPGRTSRPGAPRHWPPRSARRSRHFLETTRLLETFSDRGAIDHLRNKNKHNKQQTTNNQMHICVFALDCNIIICSVLIILVDVLCVRRELRGHRAFANVRELCACLLLL